MTETRPFPKPALILVAHGSARHPEAALPFLELARRIQERGCFAEVKAVFMKGSPAIAPPATLVSARPIVVVPVFMGKGYYTDVLVPKSLGLDQDPSIVYTPPVGTHPAMPPLLMARALDTAARSQLDHKTAALYLVAHGSSRPEGSGETALSILSALRAMGRFAQVELGFLEQQPRAEFWRDSLPKGDVIVLPLLVAAGTHANRDLPRIFGIPATHGDGTENIPFGPAGRRVVLASSIAAEPDLVDLVIELATCHYDKSNARQNVPNEHFDPDSSVVTDPTL